MKNLFILWIAIQLALIGYYFGETHNQIIDKTFNCNKIGKVNSKYYAILPLVFFVDNSSFDEVKEYCKF